MEHSKAINLQNHIDYSEGSVVSKTLVDKNVGTITLFSFGEGQGLSEHSAPYDAFVQVLDGEALVIIDKEEKKVQKGEIILMPANIPHSVKAEKRFKMMLVMIREKND